MLLCFMFDVSYVNYGILPPGIEYFDAFFLYFD